MQKFLQTRPYPTRRLLQDAKVCPPGQPANAQLLACVTVCVSVGVVFYSWFLAGATRCLMRIKMAPVGIGNTQRFRFSFGSNAPRWVPGTVGLRARVPKDAGKGGRKRDAHFSLIGLKCLYVGGRKHGKRLETISFAKFTQLERTTRSVAGGFWGARVHRASSSFADKRHDDNSE